METALPDSTTQHFFITLIPQVRLEGGGGGGVVGGCLLEKEGLL